jgi:hypothetical protein
MQASHVSINEHLRFCALTMTTRNAAATRFPQEFPRGWYCGELSVLCVPPPGIRAWRRLNFATIHESIGASSRLNER